MDGLEAVEIQFSTVLHEKLRLEAKFYSIKTFLNKEFLLVDDILESAVYNSIYGLNTKGLGYPILRMNEFETLFIGTPKQHSIKFSEKDFKKHCLKKDDILICRTNGNPKLIGKSAFVAKDYPFVYESHLFKIRANRKLINSATLSVYLNTKYGKLEIERLSMQGNQSNFSLAKFKEVRIPKFSQSFCNLIEQKVYLSFSYFEKSKSLYKQAENLLLKELNLLDFKPTTQNISIKSFSESFGSSGRLDSEYYLPKYDEVIKRIKIKNFDKLENLVNIKKSIETGSEAYSDNGVEYIRVSNLTKFGLSKSAIFIPYNFFEKEQLEELKPKKETILLSKDGTVGIAYSIKNESNIITSGAILHLTIKNKNILSEYLTLVLNSIVVQMQSQRDAGGSIIKHWKPSEIKEILIPIIDHSIQTQIKNKIKESFRLKEESKELLELAKRGVEVAIEEGEEVAIKFIKEKR